MRLAFCLTLLGLMLTGCTAEAVSASLQRTCQNNRAYCTDHSQ